MQQASCLGGCRTLHSAAPSKFQAPAMAQHLVTGMLGSLKDCIRSRDLVKGQELHAQALSSGLISNIYVANSLMHMYGKLGRMADASKIFDGMSHRDAVSWNTLMMGYVEHGDSELALEIFERVQVQNRRSFVAALRACIDLVSREGSGSQGQKAKWLNKGLALQAQIERAGFLEAYILSNLVDLYARCGSMMHAHNVFDRLAERDIVCWNTLLQGYVDNGEDDVALKLYDALEEEDGCVPTQRTYIAALMACAASAAKQAGTIADRSRWLEKGKSIHSRAGMGDIYLQNALVTMYGKCGSMTHARTVFDRMAYRDIMSWTSLMQGYTENGESEAALNVFEEIELRGWSPDAKLYNCAVAACAVSGELERPYGSSALEKGKAFHSRAVASGLCDFMMDTALIHMYAKCGTMHHARQLFDKLARSDVVSWTCLIRGYVDNGQHEVALELIAAMRADGVPLNHVTYAVALIACGNLMAVEAGRAFHDEIRELGLEQDIFVATALVEFYGKCRNFDIAEQIFDGIAAKSVVQWNALISVYAKHGCPHQAILLFEKMREQRTVPNEDTFTWLLTACNHTGLTDEAMDYFTRMRSDYGVAPGMKHYNCMVDLLGRANHLDEAVKLVEDMPMKPDSITWMSVLSSCRKWNNVRLGRLAFEKLLALSNTPSAGAYVLMANLYQANSSFDHELPEFQERSWWLDELGNMKSGLTVAK